ncbi:MAG: AMP-binding protein [Myxococcales bacterium]|nr:AMP-binding protein [Myxococcales bacterium]
MPVAIVVSSNARALFEVLAVDRDGQRFVLDADGERLDRTALRGRVAATIAALRARGVEPPARVALLTQPGAETPIAAAAAVAAGYVLVPLSAGATEQELGHVVRDAQPRAVLCADPSALRIDAADLPLLRVPRTAVDAPVVVRDADDEPALVLYTSGTTSHPRGVVHGARALCASLDALATRWGWTDRDVIVHALPMFHVHGLVVGWFGALRRAGALVWRSRFDPAVVADALQAHAPAVLFAVPTMLHRLGAAASGPNGDAIVRALRSARMIVSGSAPLPERDRRRIEALSGRPVVQRYGSTETLIVTAQQPGAAAAGAVGRPLDGVEVAILDESGRVHDAHSLEVTGEVVVRGPTSMRGYLGSATPVDADGWLHTGDVGYFGADGELRLIGRRELDVIKSGGFRVGAAEVEASLLEHDAVAEVAVVGLPDEDLGERIVAFVVPTDRSALDAERLLRWASERLARHKRPRELRLVETLPRNAMGKIDKRALRRG